jgi:hypothetical protein
MESGWDPKATRMFKKIMNSVSFTLLWMITMATAGFYFEMAIIEKTLAVKNIIFFSVFFISLLLLIRYLYITWKSEL